MAGQSHCLVFGGKGLETRNRAKDFLTHGRAFGINAGDQGGLVIAAVTIETGTAADRLCPLPRSRLHNAVDPRKLLFRDDRRKSRLHGEGVSRAIPGKPRLQLVGQRPGNLFGHDHARAGHAGLTGVRHDPAIKAIRCQIEIGIGKDQHRALAAQLQRHRLDAAARDIFHDGPASTGRSGKGHLVDACVTGDRGPGGRPVAQHDVQDTLWNTRPHGQFRHVERRIWRHFRGFQDHRIACGQGRAQLPARHGNREVPRRDGPDDAVWFVRDIAEMIR